MLFLQVTGMKNYKWSSMTWKGWDKNKLEIMPKKCVHTLPGPKQFGL